MKKLIEGFGRITGRPAAISFLDVGRILHKTLGADKPQYHQIKDRNVWENGQVLLLDPGLMAAEQQAPEKLPDFSGTEALGEDSEFDMEDDFSSVMDMNVPVYARDDVEFNSVSGEVRWQSSTLSSAFIEVIKPHLEAGGDKRAIIALGEKKSDSILTVGHFTVLVIDKVNNKYSATIVDSLVPSSVKNLVLKKVMGHSFLNANDAIQRKLEEVLDAAVDFRRLHYKHQAAVLDNSCGFFTAKLMENIYHNSQERIRPIQEIMQAEVSIVDRIEVLTTRSSFLKSTDLTQMQGYIQKPVQTVDETVTSSRADSPSMND